MGQVLHSRATTTEAVRRAIQNSQASLRTLAKQYSINPKTVAVTRNDLKVVIQNQGTTPLLPSNGFWVDLYINPDPAPTAVNQVWNDLGSYGAVWGVASEGLRLMPGEELVLTVGDRYYSPTQSNLPSQIAADGKIYVQVDSANTQTIFGNVLEGHEGKSELYNNIYSITVVDTVTTENWETVVANSNEEPGSDDQHQLNLPPR